MLAAARGHADCARLLIDAGADKEATNKVRVMFAGAPPVYISAGLSMLLHF